MIPPYAERALEPIVARMAKSVWRRHSRCFERLPLDKGVLYKIDPVDLPFVLLLRISANGPIVEVLRQGPESADATIRGSIQSLTQLAEGKIDGDALFFSRELEIEGDTEAVVALRNALDDADLDLATEFVSLAGPLAAPLKRMRSIAQTIGHQARCDLHVLQEAVLAPLAARVGAQARHLEALDARMSDLEKKIRKTKHGIS